MAYLWTTADLDGLDAQVALLVATPNKGAVTNLKAAVQSKGVNNLNSQAEGDRVKAAVRKLEAMA
jgi:hypothetical protein